MEGVQQTQKEYSSVYYWVSKSLVVYFSLKVNVCAVELL